MDKVTIKSSVDLTESELSELQDEALELRKEHPEVTHLRKVSIAKSGPVSTLYRVVNSEIIVEVRSATDAEVEKYLSDHKSEGPASSEDTSDQDLSDERITLEEAIKQGIVEQSTSWYIYEGKKIRGKDNFLAEFKDKFKA